MEDQPPSRPLPPRGDTEMPDVPQEPAPPEVVAPTKSQPEIHRPTLGRYASLGDQQLTLAERQISDVVSAPAPTPAAVATEAPAAVPVTNEAPEAPKAPPAESPAPPASEPAPALAPHVALVPHQAALPPEEPPLEAPPEAVNPIPAAAVQAQEMPAQNPTVGFQMPNIAARGLPVSPPTQMPSAAYDAPPIGFIGISSQGPSGVGGGLTVPHRAPGPPGLGLSPAMPSAAAATATSPKPPSAPQEAAPPHTDAEMPDGDGDAVARPTGGVAPDPPKPVAEAPPTQEAAAMPSPEPPQVETRPRIPSMAEMKASVAPRAALTEAPPPPPAMVAVAAAPLPVARPPAPVPGMRELRVEDALLYLDDVKREFGDRPRVYNEFLAIMKNFKSQEVDTPGVIHRVSKLFRGYNNLILGFNKFLPDGYKISLEDLIENDAIYALDQEELKRQAALAGAAGTVARAAAQHSPPSLPGAAGWQMMNPVQPKNMPIRSPEPAEQRPRGPPGLGPLAQLPTASQVAPSPPPPERSPAVAKPKSRAMPKLPSRQNATATSPAPAPPPQPQQQQQQQQQPPQQPQQPQQAPPQQAVEFDHAISYVTTIKRRFANDPSTYHSFLEILHTYQKEQRGIKEVLEQVAHLFQDHPDLLKEFTFFLPDAVQEQAKERLHRAAAESEARVAQRAMEQQKQGAEGGEAMDVDESEQQRLVDMTSQQAAQKEPPRGKKRAHKEAAVEVSPPIQLPQQPETYVYNSAVERQFFDAAREALAAYTRDGGQAWAEFLKCLDMYAQEILSRSEMLNFVEPLLGKRNNKLFEEFKRIINSAGAQTSNVPNMEDSWYSVPLSEIDFSRCRRCSPSYRALPRDYPLPPTSERTDEERKVLNDIWVSLPVGSEESYTFRHMRRNTYEEILFRCEDERFEIDMVIDSNTATLARLEPIAGEIAQLAENELVVPENSNSPKPASADQGMGGKRFQYSFDKTILGVIHRNSIARIYGDAGQEMLDLIVKNPTVAVPVVVERLRQKDMEWRKVRSRLNRRWKELAEHNYYRSLDHRSLTWRTTDKRAISTRTLIADIKDRAVHDGKEGSAAFQVRLDKAKEEHGGFYEVTMGVALGKQLDLTNLPKPDRRLFTPHMSLMYENTSWVHRDAYRILSFALERGSISPVDKERCHRMWLDFLGPWFDLSVGWMMTPAVNFQETTKPIKRSELHRVVSNGDESMADEDDEDSPDEDGEIGARVVTEDVRQMRHNEKNDSPSYMDHHPLPAGATVSTLYGDGRIIKCRRSDDTYVVQLPFGKAYLRPSAVLCSIIPAEKSAYTTQLRADDRTKLERPGDMLAIGNQSLYLFFRLHQILIHRLGIAKQLAYAVKDDQTLINMVEQMPGEDAAALGRRRYDAYLSLVFALLDGGHTLSGSAAEGGKYEDRVRTLLGHGSYALATMDKLISHLLKNLQSMANDDTMWNLVQLYRRHLDSGSFKPEAFRMEAGFLSEGEQMYAFQMCPVHKDGGDTSVLHMQYTGTIAEAGGEEVPIASAAVEPSHTKRQKRER